MLTLFGLLLILHGLAHAGPGIWASEGAGPLWFVTVLWWLATVGFVGAGLGVLGLRFYRKHVFEFTLIGAFSSVFLFYFFSHLLLIPGAVLDVSLVTIVTRAAFVRRLAASEPGGSAPWRTRVALGLATGFLAYASTVILLRPWFMRQGTTAADRSASLFGDELNPSAKYILNHAITVNAPIDSVWPWIAQLGQDRGGFYSYSTLENLAGARITNADSLVPAWQHRRIGELVRAVPADYLGGRFGTNIGWRIVGIEPGRALVLENWGAFTVRPIDARTTRLQIRQRNPGTPSVLGTVVAPAGLLILEPAHFIMQRAMLRGIKRRAERSVGLS
ncbi:MAG TPA: hypothetical protein VFT29_15135 [Gemmatimonadaceae bacterium]|nr:hypothetical protein [Gemmatimonadaceae bacterium]